MKAKLIGLKLFANIFMAMSLISSIQLFSQSSYSPYVEYIISQTNLDSISRFERELTGETGTIIGGQPYLIYSRVYDSPANDKAAQYIMERFLSWGMSARYQQYSPNGRNVIARKPGTKYPNQQYIVCGHYDNATMVPADTTHGADDNASGVCGVLEAARILHNYSFDYTIIFIAFDEEELWMYGSYAYVDSAYARGDSIRGVINLDMIAYDSNNDNKLTVITDTNSNHFASILYSTCQIYQPQLVPVKQYGVASDHLPFWEKGYVASMLIEDMHDFNAYYHTVEDNYEHINLPYMHALVKSAIAALVIYSKDLIIDIDHTPLASTFDTSGRTVTAVIRSTSRIAGGSNQPRLYYRTETTQYGYTHAFYSSQDTFLFSLPGFPVGSKVYYYLAAQDSASVMVSSNPGGCRGMNPPGTVEPPEVHSYYILNRFTVCSRGLPKLIPPRIIVFDSIFVDYSRMVMDIDVSVTINHPNDSDLYIMLNRPGQYQTNMSLHNGGSGDNYVNTIFDDEADTLITSGTPPFTGRYRPEQSLEKYDHTPAYGYWVLKILNLSESVTAELIEWCVDISYYDPIGIAGNQAPFKYSLSQNYPNPFNASTRITYEIPKQGNTKILIYDVLGREVAKLKDEFQRAGRYDVIWNANNFAAGIYFCRFIHEDFVTTRKLVLIK